MNYLDLWGGEYRAMAGGINSSKYKHAALEKKKKKRKKGESIISKRVTIGSGTAFTF